MSDFTREFERHDRFEADDDTFVPTTTDFDATVRVEDETVRVTAEVPTLDSVVEGETVAEVVEDGWYETFELRVVDVSGVTYADPVEEPTVEREGSTITVEAAIEARPDNAADDALAVANFVEGTWFEGIIPGYDYVPKVQEMRERAAHEGQEGTPL